MLLLAVFLKASAAIQSVRFTSDTSVTMEAALSYWRARDAQEEQLYKKWKQAHRKTRDLQTPSHGYRTYN